MKSVSYLRVHQRPGNRQNKLAVLAFSNEKGFGQVDFVEEKVRGKKPWRERKIKGVLEGLEEGDRLIVPELSRLGGSTLEVLEILREAKDKGVDVYAVKEGLSLNGDGMQAKIMTTMLALFAELERDFISQRTREALKARQAAGVKLGRPKGPGKSKLDPHREEIVALLKNGATKRFVAKRYDTTPVNLNNWLRKNEIDASPKP